MTRHDQATTLRNLVLRTSRAASSVKGNSARSIVLCGGQAGLGTTTVAVHLAMALARQGQRTVLIDTDLVHAGAATYCGTRAPWNLAEVLAGKRTIHEVLVLGPAGIQLVAGSRIDEHQALWTQHNIQRLLSQVASLGRHADIVIFDAASTDKESLAPLWKETTDVLLVTSPDDGDVMDAYALVKSMWSKSVVLPRLKLVVNRVASEEVASDVYHRLDRSCRRFLELPLDYAVGLPLVESPLAIGSTFSPSRLEAFESVLNLTLDRCAAQYVDGLGSASLSAPNAA